MKHEPRSTKHEALMFVVVALQQLYGYGIQGKGDPPSGASRWLIGASWRGSGVCTECVGLATEILVKHCFARMPSSPSPTSYSRYRGSAFSFLIPFFSFLFLSLPFLLL